MCLALISGLLPIWPGTHAYSDELTVGGGGRVHSATEPSDAKLGDLSLAAVSAIKVDIVFGASGPKDKVTEAPSAVSIVPADDFKKPGDRTLADVLRSVRGFDVPSDRGHNAIGTRGNRINFPGDSGGRRLNTVDGHGLNDPSTTQPPPEPIEPP